MGRRFWAVFLATFVALPLCGSGRAWAQEPPASAAKPPARLDDVPPDVRDKLSAEQLHELLMAREEKGQETPAVAIVVPVAFFLITFAIVVAALYASHRKDRHRHESLRLALERGVDVPPA